MGNDIDDALALAMLHTLQRQGECRLLGVAISKGNPWASAYTRLVNDCCGDRSIPIGINEAAPTPEEGNFIRKISESHGELPGGEEEAVPMLRRLLAAQPDHSVVLVTIGFFTNVSRLLDSPPDDVSELTGLDLFARKVRFVSSMAGNFRPEENTGPDVGNPEFNIRTDVPAAQNFVSRCPAPIFFSGFEVGAAVRFPSTAIEELLVENPDHPIAAGYAAYLPMPYDRQSWDQTAVLQAVRPEAEYFESSSAGTVKIDDEGYITFEPSEKGLHRHLILPGQNIPTVLAAIITLSTSFPATEACGPVTSIP